MYSLSDVKNAARNPNLFFHELNRLWHTRFRRHNYNLDGTDLFSEDWDNLLILDACRYDMFADQYDIPGRLESRKSRGASTPEFLYGNFHGRTLQDTVYVTSNPHIYRNREIYDLDLHAVHNVWQEDGWDDEYGTVLPETMSKYAMEIAEEYPNKRLIVHYMQPHYPFITDSNAFYDVSQAIADTESPNFWQELMKGELDIQSEDLWRAYRENLDYVLESVGNVLGELRGKTVVTSDHGNMIGERAWPIPVEEWGHPPGIYTEQLIKVPWLIVDGEERREINAEQSEESESDVAEEVVKDRLEELGYVLD